MRISGKGIKNQESLPEAMNYTCRNTADAFSARRSVITESDD